jgi:hypothetical protein
MFLQDVAPPPELAQQLSAEAAATLDVLLDHAGPNQRDSRSCFSYDTVWKLARPTLRVVLWLLPQHVVQAADGIGSASSSSDCTGMMYVTSVATVSLSVSQDRLQVFAELPLLYGTCLSVVRILSLGKSLC